MEAANIFSTYLELYLHHLIECSQLSHKVCIILISLSENRGRVRLNKNVTSYKFSHMPARGQNQDSNPGLLFCTDPVDFQGHCELQRPTGCQILKITECVLGLSTDLESFLKMWKQYTFRLKAERGSGAQQTWVQILTLPLISPHLASPNFSIYVRGVISHNIPLKEAVPGIEWEDAFKVRSTGKT